MTRTALNLSNIDFDSLKSSLKAYMSAQDAFQDINFEGSNVNVLLDLLAANSQLYLFYQHMGLSESFLDSALLKSSIVSKAKELGYTPQSAKSARAIIDVTISGVFNTPPGILMSRGTKFSGKGVDGNTYEFVSLSDVNALQTIDPTVYTYSGLSISEGRLYNVQYTVDATTKIFRIPNLGVDMSSLIVTVQTSSTINFTEEFFKSESIVGLNQSSPVYYTQMNGSGEYELYFGDGFISKALIPGNIISVSYLVGNRDLGNGISVFTVNSSLYPNVTSTAVCTETSNGGATEESIERVRDNAKKSYAAQYRSVTPHDYSTHIIQDYPHLKSVQVWGGEDNDPPMVGKVFCSVLPEDLRPLSTESKKVLEQVIKQRSVMSIKPVIIDPEIITITLDGYVRSNRHLTVSTPETLHSQVLTKISYYNDTYLKSFGGNFQLSTLTALIDKVDPSFTGTVLQISMKISLPVTAAASTYKYKFRTEIQPRSIQSTNIIIPSYSADQQFRLTDVDGKLYGYYIKSDQTVFYTSEVYGTVDYITGEVILSNFKPTMILGETQFAITATPKHSEVISVFNQVLSIDINKTTVSILASV
jgi:hypothetical protein